MTVALRLEGVRYTYAGASRPALDGIDLELEPGRVVGIVGANDAGKSTLCLVASGLAPRVAGGRLEGSVQLGGRETRDLAPYEAAQRCGILFQNPETQLSGAAPTVFEEVAIAPRNLGLDAAEVVRRVERAIDALGMHDLAPRDPARLSGGEAQLVALASVLALEPAVLALDEPTSELDPAGTRRVAAAFVRLVRERGTALLIAEHKTGLLATLADEVVVLDAGRMVLRGRAASVLGNPALAGLGVARPPAAELQLVGGAPLMGGSAVRCERLGFVYPDGTRALTGIDLEIETGELVALVGENGSGKSTLVRQFDGLLRPTEGAVSVMDSPVGRRPVADLARLVGLAFQNPDRQIFAGRVADEVAFGPHNLGMRGADLDRAVRAALERVGLHELRDANPYDLGFSKRKLLSVASVLAMETPIVILDEPTTGQDARGASQIRSIVGQLVAAGRTVIAITHDLEFVADTFPRVVVLQAGRLTRDCAPSDAIVAAARSG